MTKKQFIKAIEKLGWSIQEYDGEFYISKYSEAGEDFGFYAKNAQDIEEYAYNFDIDEHIEMWICAKNEGVKGVPSVTELVDDAREISKNLDKLSDAVWYKPKKPFMND